MYFMYVCVCVCVRVCVCVCTVYQLKDTSLKQLRNRYTLHFF